MKHALGKSLFLFCLILLPLAAENFTYTFQVDNPTPYRNEPVRLTVDINQTNPEVVLFFNFAVKQSDAYRVVQVDSVQDTTLHHSYIHYTYILYPLKTGAVDVTFDLVERVTDEHKVAYSFSGDRDDFKKLETVDRNVPVEPLTLHAKALPKGTVLVGDFKLSTEIRQHQAEAYEPINMKVVISGEGFPPVLDHIFPQEGGVTFFRQPPLVKRFPTKKSIRYEVTYTMAVSHKQSFTLSAVKLHAFDPKKEKTYLLEIPEQHFDIRPADPGSLIDSSDNPLPFYVDFSWLYTLLGYLITFAAGYLSAMLIKRKKREVRSTADPLAEKIADVADAKALLQLLMAADRARFAPDIDALEKGLYRNGKIDLKKIKHSAREKLA